jgi:hypothetical protein
MNRTRAVKYEVIAGQLDKDKDIVSLVSCNTCVRLGKTGGAEKMKQLALKLREEGYQIRDGFLITFPCWDHCLENVSLQPSVNAVVVLGCSCGCANIATRFPGLKIVPAVMDRGTVVEDLVTHKKAFRGTKR